MHRCLPPHSAHTHRALDALTEKLIVCVGVYSVLCRNLVWRPSGLWTGAMERSKAVIVRCTYGAGV
eukprot:676242-Prymnesium_polylepis.1